MKFQVAFVVRGPLSLYFHNWEEYLDADSDYDAVCDYMQRNFGLMTAKEGIRYGFVAVREFRECPTNWTVRRWSTKTATGGERISRDGVAVALPAHGQVLSPEKVVPLTRLKEAAAIVAASSSRAGKGQPQSHLRAKKSSR